MDKVIRKTEETQTTTASSESKTKAMPARKRRLDPVKKVHATEYEKRSIIAMKGHPFTRKTELATAVSTSLRCPILSLDDFLDVLTPGNYCQSTSPSSISCTPDPFLQPQDLAFRIICQVAKSNLLKGFKEIIIDSQLSSRSHLDQLIELAKSLPRTRLVIFECKTDNPYQWQTQVESYLQFNRPENNKWYKSKSWEDVEKAIKDGFDERSHGYKVSKLVLDPISDFHGSDLYIVKTLPFIDAVKYMITRGETDGPDLVLYSRWRQGQYLTSDIGGKQKLGSCRAGSGHYITNYAEKGLQYEANCMACGDQIGMGAAAYTCHHCSLALHKECAELLDGINNPTAPGNLTVIM